MTRRPRIPETFFFPFGYGIEIQRLAIEADVWGEWDDVQKKIYLDKSQTPAQMRYTFLHEMEHAFKDWLKWVAQNIPLENPDGGREEPGEDIRDRGD